MESNVSLCGSEVTRKIKQLEVEGGTVHVPHCPIAGDANADTTALYYLVPNSITRTDTAAPNTGYEHHHLDAG